MIFADNHYFYLFPTVFKYIRNFEKVLKRKHAIFAIVFYGNE